MKRILMILSTFLTLQAHAQFLPSVLQTIDTAYLAISHIGAGGYLAALRQDALDIRGGGPALGLRKQVVNIPGLTVSAGMEIAGNFAYVMNYNLTTVNLTDPEVPVIGSSLALPASMISHSHWGSWLYVASSAGKCYIYTLADPAIPALADSFTFAMVDMKRCGDRIFTTVPMGNRIYVWTPSATPPYMSLSDSVVLPAVSSVASIDVSGSQLLYKNHDSLYRFRISPVFELTPISTEALPSYPYNGKLVARDTNIIGYARYNTFYVSSGIVGNTFVDSAQIMVDGNYTITCGLLGNDLYYTNTSRTYLVGFEHSAGVQSNILANEIAIFPNPVANVLSVTIKRPGNYGVTVRNISGAQIATWPAAEGTHKADISRFPAGMYLIDICNEATKETVFKRFSKM